MTSPTTCERCPLGKHTDSFGAGVCTSCKGNTYNDQQGSTSIVACLNCPPLFEFSWPASTSFAACINVHQKVFSVSQPHNGIVEYNAGTKEHKLVAEGGHLDTPFDLAFINPTKLLVSSSGNDKIIELTADGDHIGDFAVNISGVSGIIHLEELGVTVVAGGDEGVLFFKTEDGLNNGTLTPSDAVATLSFNNSIRLLSEGENGNELLAADDSGNVFRRCFPTSGSCDSRKMKLAKGLTGTILSIAVLKDEGSYLVAEDRGTDGADVWQCPLNPSATIEVGLFVTGEHCTYFQRQVLMLASGIAVDNDSKLVFFSDAQGNKILVFNFKGLFMTRMEHKFGDLYGPSSITIKPGAVAMMSTFTKLENDEITAGTPATFRLQLKDLNNLIYNLSTAEMDRLKIAATGTVILPSGDKTEVTLDGVVGDSGSGEIVAAINMRTAGNWRLDITMGKKIKEHLLGSPYNIEVKTNVTDPRSCTTSSNTRMQVGELLVVTILPRDSFDNPTNHASDEFYVVLNGKEYLFERMEGNEAGAVAFTFNKSMTTANDYLLHVYDGSDVELADSPHFLSVVAGQVEAWGTGDILLIIGGGGICLTFMLAVLFAMKQGGKDVTVSNNEIYMLLATNMKNLSFDAFDISSDWWGFFEVVKKCVKLATPYFIVLGTGTIASLSNMGLNARQAYLVFNGLVEVKKDRLWQAALKYDKEKKEKEKGGGIGGGEGDIGGGDIEGGYGSRVLKTIKKGVRGATVGVETGIEKLKGGVAAAGDTVIANFNLFAAAPVSPDPLFYQTWQKRYEKELEVAKTGMLRDRLMFSIFVILFEDSPIFLMNMDLIAKLGLFGCSDDLELKPKFVVFTMVSVFMMGWKVQKVVGLFGETGVRQKLKGLNELVEELTLKGEKELGKEEGEVGGGGGVGGGEGDAGGEGESGGDGDKSKEQLLEVVQALQSTLEEHVLTIDEQKESIDERDQTIDELRKSAIEKKKD